MKKKILVSVMVIALASALIGGGVYAVFSDTEDSTGNTFTAGTLNLTADVTGGGTVSGTVTPGDDGVNEYITLSDLKPGDSGTVTWTCTNIGTLAGTLTIASTLAADENTLTEPETSATPADTGDDDDGADLDSELDDYVGVTLTRNGTYILGSGAGAYVPLSGLEAVLDAESQSMTASGTIVYVLSWSIASDVETTGDDGVFGTDDANEDDVDDNILQSDDAIIDITFTLTQS